MNKVTSYLKNVGKSVAFATVDVASKKLIPEVSEFTETNAELFKSVYATVSHSKRAINYGKKLAIDSQVYKDINKGINNALSDIKSGNFYNKQREQQAIDEVGEFMANGGGDFDDSDFGDFGDFDDFDDGSLDQFEDKPSKSASVSKGDLAIVDSVSKSTNLSAQLISKTVANTSKAIMNTSVATTNMVMAQNVELMAGLRTSIAGMHQSINGILEFAHKNITTQINNEAAYFSRSQELLEDNNRILREMLDIQKNMYKTSDKGKSSDQFGDIFSGGAIDLKEYFKVVGKNIKALVDSTGTMDMMFDNSMGGTMLGQMLSNPLGGLMTGLIAGFMPKSLAKSIASFSKTLGGIFPSMLSKMNKWKEKDGILGLLGKVFGIKSDTKRTIDTDKYNKGAVPFDGITRKAIVDVIPEHLSKIESLLSGQTQRIYDYDTGKWMSTKDIQKKQKEEYERLIKDSFSDLDETINAYRDRLIKSKALSYNQLKQFDDDVMKMKTKTFEEGGHFSPRDFKKDIKNYNYTGFQSDEKLITELLNTLEGGPLSNIMSVSSKTFENKKRYGNFIRDAEESGTNIFRKLYDNSNNNSHLKYDENFKDEVVGMKTNSGIIGARDKLGKNALDYLRDITINLAYIRSGGASSGNAMSFEDYKNRYEKSHVPENIAKLRERRDKEESSFNSRNYNDTIDTDKAALIAGFDALTKTKYNNLDEDEMSSFGKFNKDNSTNKHEKIMDQIPGKNFGEKFKNAKSFKERYSLLLGSMHKVSKKPAEMLEGLINKANESIYHLLFEAEFDEDTDDERPPIDKRIKGLFGKALDNMQNAWTVMTETLTEKVIDPLAKKYGLEDKWNNFKDKLGNTNIAQRLKDAKTGISNALRSNVTGIKDYTISSIKSVKNDIQSQFTTAMITNNTSKMQDILNNISYEDAVKLNQALSQLSRRERAAVPNSILMQLAGILKSRKATIQTKAKGGIFNGPNGTKIVVANENEDIFVANQDDYKNLGKNAKKENRVASKLKSLLGNKVHISTRESGSKIEDFVDLTKTNKDLYMGDNIGRIIAESAAQSVKNHVDELFGSAVSEENKKKIEKQKTKIFSKVTNIFGEMKGSGYDTAAKAIIGSGIGLFSGIIGGPLLGAAAGAGYSIIKNSTTVQKFLFGEDVVDDKGEIKHEGGIIKKSVQDTFKKYIPDMGKYGVTGAVASLLLPFGPLAGAAIGAGIGLVKNSETMNEMIFGEEDGLFNKDRKEKIKKAFPMASAGAVAGLFLGPFGILGNATLGAGIGLLTQTEEFRNLIFGEEDENGERFGGIKGALNDHFVYPLKDFATDFKDNFFAMLKENMIDPLNEAITPLTHEIAYQTKRVVFAIPKYFARLAEDKIGAPIAAAIRDKLVDPILGFTRGIIKRSAKFAQSILFAPFKGVRNLSRGARAAQIKRGDATYMGAEERIQFMRERGKSYDLQDQDMALMNMNDEDIQKALGLVQGTVKGVDYFDREARKNNSKLGRRISENFKEGHIGGGNAGKIRRALNNGDVTKATELLYDLKSRGKINTEEYDKYVEDIRKLAIKNQKLKTQRQNISKFLNGDGEIDQSSIMEELNKAGIKVNNKQDLKRLLKNLEGEKKYRKNLKGDLTTKEMRENLSNDGAVITSWLEKIYNKISGIQKDAGGTEGLTDSQIRNIELDNIRSKETSVASINRRNAKLESRKSFLRSLGIADNILSDKDVVKAIQNDDLYYIISNAAKKNVKLTADNIINLTKFNKDIIKELKKRPELASLDAKSISRYLGNSINTKGFNTKFNKNILSSALNSGVDLGSLGNVDEFLHSGTTKKGTRTRLEYFNKFKKAGLLDKYGQSFVWTANFEDLDMILKNSDVKKSSGINAKDILNSDDSKLNSGSNDVETHFTDDGVINYVKNDRGSYNMANDKETKETLQKQNEKLKTQNSFMSTMTAMKDGIFGIFNRQKEKDEKEKKEPSFIEKLFDFDMSGISSKLKFGGAILAAVTGIGALKNLWDNREPGGVLDTVGNIIKEKVEGPLTTMKEWFTNTGEFENKGGLQGFLSDHVFPNLFTGMNVIFQYVVPAILKAFIVNIPTMVKAGISGIGELLGFGKNKHANDNKIDANSIKGATSGGSLGKFAAGTIKGSSNWLQAVESQAKEVSRITIDDANSSAQAVTGSSGASYFNTDLVNVHDEDVNTSGSSNPSTNTNNNSTGGGNNNSNNDKNSKNNNGYNDSEQAVIGDSVYMFKKDKDGQLVPITMKEVREGKITDFYTKEGAHYIYNPETNDFESEAGDTYTKSLGLPGALGAVTIRSALKGKSMGIIRLFNKVNKTKIGSTVLKGTDKVLSKTPVVKTAYGITKTFGKGVGGLSKGAANIKNTPSLLKNGKDNLKVGLDLFKEGESLADISTLYTNNKAVQKIAKIADKISPELNKVIEFLRSALKGLFKNNTILDKIKSTVKITGKKVTDSNVSKLINETVEKMMTYFTTKIAPKIGTKTITKIATKAASAATVVLPIALAVVDFGVGYDQAESILGISEVNIVQRLLAGIINAINNELLFGLIDTSIVVDWCVDTIFPIFGINMEEFQKEREETEKGVEEYNKQHGTNYSSDEYLKKDKLTWKITQGWGTVKEKVGEFGSWVGDTTKGAINGVKKGASWIGEKAGQAGSWIGEKASGTAKGINSAVGAAGDKLEQFGSWAGEKISIGSELAKYAATVTKDVFRDAFAGENVETEGVAVDKDDPLRESKHTIYQLVKIIGLFAAIPVHVGRYVYDTIKPVIDGIIDIGGGVGNTIKSSFSKAWNGDLIGALTVKENTNTGNAFIDTISNMTNSVVKVPLSIPTILTSGIGFVVRNFDEIVNSVKAVGMGVGQTVGDMFTKAWDGDVIGAFTSNRTSDTGNDFVDGVSNVINNVIKIPLAGPTILTSGIGFAVKALSSVVDGIKQVGSSAGNVIANTMKTAMNAQNPLDVIFNDKDDAKTGNGLIDGTSKFVNTAIKFPLTPVALLTAAVSKGAQVINGFITSIKNVSTLSSADQKIIDNSKKGKVSPLSTDYWKINTKLTGIEGGLYTFNSIIKKVLNLPMALLGMINPANWFDTGVDWIADKLGISDDEFNGTTKKKTTKKTGKGSGKVKGFISQLDPRYRNTKFNKAGDTEYQTIGDSGCGPATAANVVNLFSGQGSTMEDASKAALRYKDRNGGVTPEYFENYLGSKGIGTYSTMNKNEMVSSIASGKPTILLGSDPSNRANTPYGSVSSHYVLATGMDRNGNVIVQDPESRRPNSIYPMKDLIKQSHLGMVTGRASGKINQFKSSLRSKLIKLGFGRGSNTVNQDLATWSPLTADEINNIIRSIGSPNCGFSGHGDYFVKAANVSGLDPRYILAHAALESAWGNSSYAKAGNFFGIGAFDSNPDNAYNYGNDSMESGLVNGASWIRKNYYDAGQKTLYTMRFNNGVHQYATDPAWHTKIANIMDQMPKNTNAVYHDANGSAEGEDGSSTSNSLFDQLAQLPYKYFDKGLMDLIFGSSDSSSSESSESGSSSGSSLGSGIAKQFHDKYLGQRVDVDGAYGSQCVDLFSKFKIDHVDGSPSRGNAVDLWGNYKNGPSFKGLPYSEAQYGDWIIWGPGAETTSFGHVGMFMQRQGNGRVLTFGQNQGAGSNLTTGGPANETSISESGILGVLRATSGKGSGKNKDKIYNYITSINKPMKRMDKIPGLPANSPLLKTDPKIFVDGYKQGVEIDSMNGSLMSGKGSLPTLNLNSFKTEKQAGSMNEMSSISSSNGVERLINVIIDILSIIANNTSKLSDIVTLLSKSLDLNLTNDEISSLSSNNAQIKNKLANALKAQGSPTGLGSSIMNTNTETLANALYSIARA